MPHVEAPVMLINSLSSPVPVQDRFLIAQTALPSPNDPDQCKPETDVELITRIRQEFESNFKGSIDYLFQQHNSLKGLMARVNAGRTIELDLVTSVIELSTRILTFIADEADKCGDKGDLIRATFKTIFERAGDMRQLAKSIEDKATETGQSGRTLSEFAQSHPLDLLGFAGAIGGFLWAVAETLGAGAAGLMQSY
jgi:hypothetical protein